MTCDTPILKQDHYWVGIGGDCSAMRCDRDRFVMDAVTLAMYQDAMVIDRFTFVIDAVTLAMYGHTFEIDRDQLVIDHPTFEIDHLALAMSAIAVAL